jgi:hypothetical protein
LSASAFVGLATHPCDRDQHREQLAHPASTEWIILSMSLNSSDVMPSGTALVQSKA